MMHTETSILIKAPLNKVFEVTSNLLQWPKILPHYRWVRLQRLDDDGLVVHMGARRGWLPIQWTSRFVADANSRELRFHHLKAFTRGMQVKWTYTPTPDGVEVRIAHELNRRTTLGRWFARRVIGEMFIKPVASQTLKHFKLHLENNAP